MSTKWDCKTTKEFIEEYKLYDCLWNFKSSSYKNKHMCESAIKESKKSGSGVDTCYVSNI